MPKHIDIGPHKITYKPQDGGGYVIYSHNERLGLVRLELGVWHCVDTCFVKVGRRGWFRTRGQAVQALLRRKLAVRS